MAARNEENYVAVLRSTGPCFQGVERNYRRLIDWRGLTPERYGQVPVSAAKSIARSKIDDVLERLLLEVTAIVFHENRHNE